MKEKLDKLAFIKVKIFVPQKMLFKVNEKTTYSLREMFSIWRW